jgi:flagellar L-ring protein FlgH
MKRTLKSLLLISIALLMFSTEFYADSLWENSSGAYYGSSKRRIRVGDIITVYISEATSAVQAATTSTKKNASLGTNIENNWDQVANLLGNETIRKTFDFGFSGDDEYEGSGQTSRRSKVKAVVTSIVTEILDSGNLFIVGEHNVKVNNEIETIHVSGVIRPQDISVKNSVFSYQIAKAQVSVNGEGVVAAKQTPGMMTKMFNWLF